ncbi:TrkA family potassium uptake protein [Halobaculum sp. MBLA0147]|uniref:potassium channel family protein n=1 Tax=Halobaculum sp. MBLA0147 TaxID=3079934 RepID=UPI003523FE44
MRVVIAGYGRVGSRTARVLDEEGHDVTLVENVPEKAETARERGFTVVEGDASNPSVLEEAGIEDADAVAGLTGNPTTNFEICSLGKEYGCRTVMRLSEDVPDEIYDEYEASVDEVIYPERLGAAGAKTALLGGNFNAIGELTEDLQLTTVTVTEDAPVVGRRVNDLSVDGARIYAHGRERESLTIPLPGTEIEAGDRLAIVVEGAQIGDVRDALLGA